MSRINILASCLIQDNSYLAFASNLESQISESHNSDLIAQARTYRVRLGDTLAGIANRLGMSVPQILNYNPHLRSRPNLIYVGEIINLEARRPVTFRSLPTARRDNRICASRRCDVDYCTKDRKPMRAIAPENGLGYTFDDYPYFFWYFPGVESDSVPVIFSLIGQETREINGKTRTRATKIYEKELNLDKSGIIAFPLPPEKAIGSSIVILLPTA
ncbi:MAG: DUF928 domain-containing protein [Pleurocapsa sp. MO_226.B13]|nr:DUF928 domain-containing protein [Pleurocapsa sp. MO_226.B13]